jgi:hypothetical protein
LLLLRDRANVSGVQTDGGVRAALDALEANITTANRDLAEQLQLCVRILFFAESFFLPILCYVYS